jgi:transglutaminase-like putative cysteine protease
MLLELTHQTTFDYSEPAAESYMEFRLTPLTDGSQHLLQHRPRVTPNRTVRQYVDARGNTVSYVNLLAPQERIEVSFDSVVETYPTRVRAPEFPFHAAGSPHGRLHLYDYLCPTDLTRPTEAFLEFARQFEPLRGAPPAEAAEEIRRTIYRGFRYEKNLTDVSSTIDDVLGHRGGVCQDFAHLMIAAGRHLELAVRYVSGYVLPEEGEAASSHAWCEVFDPAQGWLGLDPTHDAWTEERYVRLGVGRDYQDVPPSRGLYRGPAAETVTVSVRLAPITPDHLAQRARTFVAQPRGVAPTGRMVRKAPSTSILYQTQIAQQQQ